jgi:hypothetical protein
MTSEMMRQITWVAIALGVMGLEVGSAWGIVGRPLTPMSVAGVARRTTRRAVVGTAVVAGSVAVANDAYIMGHAHTHYVTTLPTGCVKTIVGTMTYQNCGGTYYQPSYDGPNVVYVPVPTPTG